jgi:hypothetical protein
MGEREVITSLGRFRLPFVSRDAGKFGKGRSTAVVVARDDAVRGNGGGFAYGEAVTATVHVIGLDPQALVFHACIPYSWRVKQIYNCREDTMSKANWWLLDSGPV